MGQSDMESRLWHAYYDSTISCSSGTMLPTQVRIYSPSRDPGLLDFTIAFVIARGFIFQRLCVRTGPTGTGES